MRRRSILPRWRSWHRRRVLWRNSISGLCRRRRHRLCRMVNLLIFKHWRASRRRRRHVIAMLVIGYPARQRRLVHFGWRRRRRSSSTQAINHVVELTNLLVLTLQLSLKGTVCLDCHNLRLLRTKFSTVSRCRLFSRLGRWTMTVQFLSVVCLVRFHCAELFARRFLTTQSRQNDCLKSYGGGDGLIQSVRIFLTEPALKRRVIQRVDEIVNAQSLTHVSGRMRVGAADQTFQFLC